MAFKRTPLTQEQFDRLQVIEWNIDEVPREHWDKIPGLERLQDTFAVMASGDVRDIQVLNRIAAVAGLDVLVREPKPYPKEPEGNAYHYVIQETKRVNYLYLIIGPYRSETIVDHWFEAEQLERYWTAD